MQAITTGDECLVERFGKYHRKLGPGWHWISRPFETVSYHVTTREQVMDIPPQQAYTIDNAPITADAVVYMRVVDLIKARYEIRDVKNAILNLCLTQLREEVGKLTLDECFSSRDRINKALLENLNSVCATWGIQITRIEIQEMQPSRDILAAMEMQMAAERKKRAAILQSEGERTTLTNEAEGRAKAILVDSEAKAKSMVTLAKAEAERMRLEAEGMKMAISEIASSIQTQSAIHKESVEGALQMIMLTRYLETQAKFANTNGTKVLMFPTKDRYVIDSPYSPSIGHGT
jgi:regulator of protease activity HflC (stomatin/prohibitin superfamily)